MRPSAKLHDSDLPKARLRLWLKMLKAQGSIEAEIRRRLRDEFGFTLPRFDVMSALSRFPKGLKMSEISNLLKVSNGNVTGIVERLTQDGLAVRVAVPEDRRAQLVRLTSAGTREFSKLATAHEGWIDDMLAGVPADRLDDFSALLDTITDHLERREDQTNAK